MKKDDYGQLILDALLDKEIITEDLYEKCKPEYIQSLPYDGNARTEGKLQIRVDKIEEKINEEEKNLEKLKKEKTSLEKDLSAQEKNIKKLVSTNNEHIKEMWKYDTHNDIDLWDECGVGDYWTPMASVQGNVTKYHTTIDRLEDARLDNVLKRYFETGNPSQEIHYDKWVKMEGGGEIIRTFTKNVNVETYVKTYFDNTKKYYSLTSEIYNKQKRSSVIASGIPSRPISSKFKDKVSNIKDGARNISNDVKKYGESKQALTQIEKDIKSSTKKIKDLKEEQGKTEDKLNKIGE